MSKKKMGVTKPRGNTWVGVRPVTFDKRNSKKDRREAKKLIRAYK